MARDLSRKKARLKCRISKYQKGDVILNIGILGGSFDPPHFGHIFLCHYALKSTEIEKVLIVPCFNHPFNKSLSTFEHRFSMCQLAFEIFGNSVEVTDIEKELGGISYSINTIKHLKNTHPDNQYFFLIGSDILKDTNKWKNFEVIKSLVKIIIFHRIGSADVPSALLEQARCPRHKSGDEIIQASLPDTSSELIRTFVKQNKPIQFLTTNKIIDYIKNNKLYK